MSFSLPTYDDVARAAKVLEGVAHRTPVFTSSMLNDSLGAQVFFKCENFQRVGAFKFRGGYNAIAALSAQQRKAGVVAFSSGNHAQAVALAARMQGTKAVIVMPHDAPAAKKAATREYGASIVSYDRYTEDRQQIAQQLVESDGLSLIPPFDHAQVIAGQGTAAQELFQDIGALDQLYVCLGGGGLLSGSLLAAQALSPNCDVYGIEPEAGNDGQQSIQEGKIVRIDAPQSIADGALTTSLGMLTFPIIQRYVAAILTASDTELTDAMRFFAERMKMIVEPTGCLGAAALFNKKIPAQGQRIGVLISGGNVDLSSYAAFLANRNSRE